MCHRFPTSQGALAVAIALVSLAAVSVKGQAPAAKTTKLWTPPRTPNGQPDLQGVWNYSAGTPLERPAAFAGKLTLTDDELAQAEKRILERNSRDRRDGSGTNADVNRDHNEFWDEKRPTILMTRRTSLIIDPPDGHVPPLTPEARRREAARAEARRGHGPADSWEDQTWRTRCIWSQIGGPPMLAPEAKEVLLGNMWNFQILQTPDYVAILQEDFQELRIIPLGERPHIGRDIRQWLGDSRGHWEGDTLVVDTTNFTAKTNFRGSSANLHLTERFTRVAADAIDYQFTVDDPTTWTRPWTVAMPVAMTKGLIYEYGCHEGNYSLPDILGGARAQEKAAAEAATKGSK
jgi:hypothetical protein